MREYELIIDKALKKGLSPERSIPINDDWLWQALDFRIGRNDLEGYDRTTEDPLAGRVDMLYSWPFPQWISGERYNFLIIRDSIVNMEDRVFLVADDYTVTHIFDVDVLTFGLGTMMEVADFGEYAFMTNGVIMIYWDVGLADWQEIVASATIPMMRTVCNFKGQAVGGNIVSAWHDCDDTFYVWSRIGEMDFTPTLRNEEGYRRCPYGGTVYHTRRLGDHVVGYSSKGITLLSPVTSPAATFGFTELDDVGLINQGAIDGDIRRHVYVGTDYVIREIALQGDFVKKYDVKELGYYRYIEDLGDAEPIIVKYDRIKKDFYIGNSEKTYLLSPYGLTEVTQHPSALWTMSSDDKDVVMLPNTLDGREPMLATTVFDMGYRGQKTIFSIETDALLTFNPEVTVGWMSTLAVWGYSNTVPLNNEGIACIIASGNEFMVQISCDFVAVDSPIKYIKVRYKMTDLRGIRGVYAPPIRGQN